MAAHLARDFCAKGQRCLYFAFEESEAQILRNMLSIGLALSPFVRNGTLRIVPFRPQTVGLEQHLTKIHTAVMEADPQLVIMDPISNMAEAANNVETRSMLTRLIDFLKSRGITSLLTNLTAGGADLEQTEVGISSLIDTWLMLEVVRSGGERNRVINLIKSRGMAHSNQIAELRLTDKGVDIVDTYVGAAGVLTGSARITKEAEDQAASSLRTFDISQRKALRESRRRAFEARIEALREELVSEEAELERAIKEQELLEKRSQQERVARARSRRAFAKDAHNGKAKGKENGP